MVKLNCTARSCVYNEGGLCSAQEILVQGINSNTSENTYCSSFRLDTVSNEFRAIGSTNFPGEVMQIFSSQDEIKLSPLVNCHARNCFYNGGGICGARDISVMGDGAREETETMCETFIK
ncbi:MULTISPECIES: DUF1540 domain-containing protein [Clostridium]|uniref:DUF1540 domain-containing protein n=1 Tax=Clostridium cibarium TaxID=2762247 RepID=A0ABR8PSJ7_9CLOT|nr:MULTISPECIES: DUF1540 domain-containing protein [Clostridium]MBD7911095.1 DUF1540 domain-containing protein [Clostridium cibarium]